MIRPALVAASLGLAGPVPAAASTLATVLDFNLASAPPGGGLDITGVDLGGVTFTTDGPGAVLNLLGSPGAGTGFGTGSIRSLSFSQPVIATFTTPVSLVSLDIGDFGSGSGPGDPLEADSPFVFAYDAGSALLAQDQAFLPADVAGLVRLSVAAPGIAFVAIGSNGIFPNSVVIDNFSFLPEPVAPPPDAVVPLPASLPLFLAVLLLLGAIPRLIAVEAEQTA